MGLLKTVSFNPKLPVILANSANPDQTSHCVYQCPSPGFTDSPFLHGILTDSDKKSAAISKVALLDFVQTRGSISLVSDNQVDSNLRDILVYVY